MMEIKLSTTSQAQDRAERIRTALNVSWQLIKDAYLARDWVALGYDSWDDYCGREFGSSRVKLPMEERQGVVASMREIGMSTRAIASATGVHDRTVRRELAAAASAAPESDPVPVTGTDGKTYTPHPEPSAQTPTPEPGAKAEPQKPRRTPITDEVWNAILNIKKALTKLAETASDDRFIKNKTQIAELASNDLGLIIKSIAEYRDNLK